MSIASCDSDDQGGLGAIASLRSREGRRRAEKRQIFISLEYGEAGLTCGTHPIAVVVVFVPILVARLAVLAIVLLFLLPLLLALVPTASTAVSFLVTSIPLIVVL